MALFIRAMRDGFRRAGIAHLSAGTYHADDAFSEEQLEALKGEPQLIVLEGVEEPEEVDGDESEDGLEGGGTQTGSAPGASKPQATGAKTGRVKASK
ncbi:HI1506-related protein [Pseudomonas violetae]|uniref:HI1506-related protein n=1 Tax=Pseudomonas violetae TaxID=2915813 RepID=A0ABT0EZP5_9PSED|nr:HI1506-related protein [Pseudomonas violetae]MCK1791170.1 HI1506-related protein [Pseudomonas violetae]